MIKYENALNTIYEMIDQCTQDRETPITQSVVNQVLRQNRTNGEFIFSAHIG
jgi:hypothetical protein